MADPDPVALVAALDSEIASRLEEAAPRSLAVFTRLMWREIEPTTDLEWGRHLDVLCTALQLQAERRESHRNLLLLVPPGSCKSILASVMAPAWTMLHWPGRRSIFVSSTETFSERDSRRTREIIASDTYQRILHRLSDPSRPQSVCPVCQKMRHSTWTFSLDENQRASFENTQKGFRQCLGITSNSITGRRGDSLVFDDCLDARKVMLAGSQAEIAGLLEDVDRTARYIESTRVNDQRKVTRTWIMQRLSEGDPAGRRLGMPGWRTICLPLLYEPDHPNLSPEDWRTEPGELLHPGRFDMAYVEELKRALGNDFSAQYQQRPRAKDGGMVKVGWTSRRYAESPKSLAASCSEIVISIDATFTGASTSDRVSMGCWGKIGMDAVLLDRDSDRLSWLELKRRAFAFFDRWPEAHVRVIEAAANGHALAEEARQKYQGVVLQKPVGAKAARFKAAAVPWFEGGNVVLPASSVYPWVDAYIDEVTGFGAGAAHDDDADMTAIALSRLAGAKGEVDIPFVQQRAILNAGGVRRWSYPSESSEYVVGVGAERALSEASAAWAVVLDRDGQQVASIVVSEGGVGRLGERVAEESLYWNGARAYVGGKGLVASQVLMAIAKAGGRVGTRDGRGADAGELACWSGASLALCWTACGGLAADGRLVLRDERVASAARVVRVVRDVLVVEDGAGVGLKLAPPAAVALAVASAAVERKMRAVLSVVPGKRLTFLGKREASDFLSRSSLVRL